MFVCVIDPELMDRCSVATKRKPHMHMQLLSLSNLAKKQARTVRLQWYDCVADLVCMQSDSDVAQDDAAVHIHLHI